MINFNTKKRSSLITTSMLAVSLGVASLATHAALPINSTAPSFTANAALAGKDFSFSLDKALKKGPVVLYFFPVAFSSGCTLEAHAFAEASDSFNAKGATVYGITAGNVEKIKEFSAQECRNKFAIIADPGAKIAKEYDSLMVGKDKLLSNRTSYVITPDHKVLMSYTDSNPEMHIHKTMDAVTEWQKIKK
ncbi:peroxiredoxin [Acinetobacter boissieri]|uniref:thioredoxin-dependent peroxiredoxin n=1 Tax=Acinetobacter boissieri TaxID=1219383 RepID=A0A1G6IXG2_9GAMM|nr:peroxiredoxin [Acinetobacter boissieri]SDC10466.1 Peroxiredoxin [Acinetobacter boissieri]